MNRSFPCRAGLPLACRLGSGRLTAASALRVLPRERRGLGPRIRRPAASDFLPGAVMVYSSSRTGSTQVNAALVSSAKPRWTVRLRGLVTSWCDHCNERLSPAGHRRRNVANVHTSIRAGIVLPRRHKDTKAAGRSGPRNAGLSIQHMSDGSSVPGPYPSGPFGALCALHSPPCFSVLKMKRPPTGPDLPGRSIPVRDKPTPMPRSSHCRASP
jgi:hypothetical protein